MGTARCYCCLVFFAFALLTPNIFAQKPAATPAVGTALVAGRVSVDSGVLAGIQVQLRQVKEQPLVLNHAPPLTAITDTDGNYQFTNVPAGKYALDVHAPAYVIERNESRALVVVEEHANLQNQDFKLRRGGVITGKVTDPEGHPLIEESITLRRQNEQGKAMQENYESSVALLAASRLRRTDDRGIYRIFGLQPGRYLVSAGSASGALGGLFGGKAEFKMTYYPGTANEAEARFVEVNAGVEAENIDFALVRADAKKGYVASGRVIESDTGKPVSGLMLMSMPANPGQPTEKKEAEEKAVDASSQMPGTTTTNANGEFRFENLTNGSYNVTAMNLQAFMGGGSETYAEPLRFEIRGGDATGLVMKMLRGTTISGNAVIEGARPPQSSAKLTGMMLMGMPAHDGPAGVGADALSFNPGSMVMGNVQPDGSFRLTGVAPGKLRIEAQSLSEQTLRLMRIEQNNAVVELIEVSGTMPVTGVRLIFGAATGVVTGRVEVRGGTLPPGTKIYINASEKDAPNSSKMAHGEADARGRFSLSDLLPGVYEISVSNIFPPPYEQPLRIEGQKQTVVVTDKAKQEIVLYVDLKAKEEHQ